MTVKHKVLTFLEERRGEFISGTKMAQEIGVSRNAVWKAIKELEMDNYQIEALKNKGYSLSETSDKLSLQSVKAHLPNLNINSIYYFETIDSTNTKAKELALQGAAHGTVVIANEQTKGRGRYGKVFDSPKESGIYMSIILKPSEIKAIPIPMMTAYTAVLVSEILTKFSGENVGIKWVNDLFLEDKKIAGILTEAVSNLETGLIDWIVVGVGINITTKESEFSEEVKEKATALFSEKTSLTNRSEIIAEIIRNFLSPISSRSILEIMDIYREKSVVIGRYVEVKHGKDNYEAFVETILDDGTLVLLLENGQRKEVKYGEVSLII